MVSNQIGMDNLQEIKVSYERIKNPDKVSSSEQAYEVIKKAYALSGACMSLREYFFVIFLNRSNKVIGYYQISAGGTTGTIADPKLAFSIALKCLASAIILSHNHPSGAVEPSESDNSITNKFKNAGLLLDIKVLDHLIVTDDNYFSYADEGFL